MTFCVSSELAMAMHRDNLARRKQIADEMKSIPLANRAEIVGEVASKFGVCSGTVRLACKEFKVVVPATPRK
jgi:hypothetical protein